MHHNLLKKKQSCYQGVILHSGSSLYLLASIIYSQNDMFPLLGTDQIDGLDKVNIPFIKWSKGYDRDKWSMVPKGQTSYPLASITPPNISLDILE